MEKVRKPFIAFFLATSAVALVTGFWALPSRFEEANVASGIMPWICGTSLAYGLISPLAAATLADINHSVAKVLRWWTIFLGMLLVVWLLPLALSSRLGWSVGSCLEASLKGVLLLMVVSEVIGRVWAKKTFRATSVVLDP